MCIRKGFIRKEESFRFHAHFALFCLRKCHLTKSAELTVDFIRYLLVSEILAENVPGFNCHLDLHNFTPLPPLHILISRLGLHFCISLVYLRRWTYYMGTIIFSGAPFPQGTGHHHVCGHGRTLTHMLQPFYSSFVFPQEALVTSCDFLSSILRLLSVRKTTSIKKQVSPELPNNHNCPISLLFQ